MKQRKISIVLMALLILPMIAATIQTVYAVDTGLSWWTDAKGTPAKPAYPLITTSTPSTTPPPYAPPHTNDEMVLKTYDWDDVEQLTLNFTVSNMNETRADARIVRVQLHLYEEDDDALFHYVTSNSSTAEWQTRVLEADTARGWARLIEWYVVNPDFAGTGIVPKSNQTFTFSVGYLAPGKSVVPDKAYTFIVTKVTYEGYAENQYIYLYFDTTKPEVHIEYPTNTTVTPIIGDLLQYCGHHYLNATFNATDTSGLREYVFQLRNSIGTIIFEENSTRDIPGWVWPNATTFRKTYNFTDLPDGSYTANVRVWDRVGNDNSETSSFGYQHPQKPFWLAPTSGFAAIDTWWNSTSGLVESESKTFGSKTLGTNVTAYGYKFAPSTTVTITVRIVTYDYFSGVDYEVPVAKATTDSVGNFTASFIFPKAPKGVYNVTATSSSTNPAYVIKCAAEPQFTVSEKAIYKPLGDNPDVLIGPDVINVEATGFIAPDIVPETYSIYLLCNNKDALQGINQQVLWYWYFDGNGSLQNALTFSTGRFVENGIVWPSLQPGTYNLTLFLVSPGKWWNLDHWVTQTNDEYTNTVTVHETLSLLISIKADTAIIRTDTGTIITDLTTLKPIVDRIDGNVVTLSTTLGNVQATLDQLSPVITRIDGNVVTLNTAVGQINTTMATIGPQLAAIGPDIATIKTSVGTDLSGKVTYMQGNVTTITTGVGDIQTQVPNLTTPIYVAVVFSIIAAIAAIACAFLVFRKIA